MTDGARGAQAAAPVVTAVATTGSVPREADLVARHGRTVASPAEARRPLGLPTARPAWATQVGRSGEAPLTLSR